MTLLDLNFNRRMILTKPMYKLGYIKLNYRELIMILLNPLRIGLKALMVLFLLTINNFASASVTVKVEDAGLHDWASIQNSRPGFGSNGPVSLDWDSEILYYSSGYSGGAAAFCFFGDILSCGLGLSVTEENTLMKLESFTLGYSGYGSKVKYSVIDLATETSILSGIPWVSGDQLTFINVNAESDKGFLILFGPDGFNGGINNISYSYSSFSSNPAPVPIPTAAWLFASMFIGLVRFSRHSKRN